MVSTNNSCKAKTREFHKENVRGKKEHLCNKEDERSYRISEETKIAILKHPLPSK